MVTFTKTSLNTQDSTRKKTYSNINKGKHLQNDKRNQTKNSVLDSLLNIGLKNQTKTKSNDQNKHPGPVDPTYPNDKHDTNTPPPKPRKKFTPVTMEDLFAPLKWAKYISINFPEDAPLSALRTFNFLQKYMDIPEPSFRIEKNQVVVRAPSELLSARLLQLKELDTTPVTTTDKNCLNQRIGTVLIDKFQPGPQDSDDFIAQCVKDIFTVKKHRVESVMVYDRPNRSRTRTLKFGKITFNQQTIPTDIVFAGKRITIQEVLPRPMLCNKCLRFGHTFKRCRDSIQRCGRCGSAEHRKENCISELKCFNCAGLHDSFDYKCPHFLYHQEVEIRTMRYGISRGLARADMRAEGRAIDIRPWSQVVLSSQDQSKPQNSANQQYPTPVASKAPVVQQQPRASSRTADALQSAMKAPDKQVPTTSAKMSVATKNKFSVLGGMTDPELISSSLPGTHPHLQGEATDQLSVFSFVGTNGQESSKDIKSRTKPERKNKLSRNKNSNALSSLAKSAGLTPTVMDEEGKSRLPHGEDTGAIPKTRPKNRRFQVDKEKSQSVESLNTTTNWLLSSGVQPGDSIPYPSSITTNFSALLSTPARRIVPCNIAFDPMSPLESSGKRAYSSSGSIGSSDDERNPPKLSRRLSLESTKVPPIKKTYVEQTVYIGKSGKELPTTSSVYPVVPDTPDVAPQKIENDDYSLPSAGSEEDYEVQSSYQETQKPNCVDPVEQKLMEVLGEDGASSVDRSSGPSAEELLPIIKHLPLAPVNLPEVDSTHHQVCGPGGELQKPNYEQRSLDISCITLPLGLEPATKLTESVPEGDVQNCSNDTITFDEDDFPPPYYSDPRPLQPQNSEQSCGRVIVDGPEQSKQGPEGRSFL